MRTAYAAAVTLGLINEEEIKAIDFVRGDEEAITKFLTIMDTKYSLHQGQPGSGNGQPVESSTSQGNGGQSVPADASKADQVSILSLSILILPL